MTSSMFFAAQQHMNAMHQQAHDHRTHYLMMPPNVGPSFHHPPPYPVPMHGMHGKRGHQHGQHQPTHQRGHPRMWLTYSPRRDGNRGTKTRNTEDVQSGRGPDLWYRAAADVTADVTVHVSQDNAFPAYTDYPIILNHIIINPIIIITIIVIIVDVVLCHEL